MSNYEYKVITAPTKGVKAKGMRTVEDRFSHALELKINALAAEGWEYQRAEALPSVERAGLTSTKTTWHNVLVFRRSIDSKDQTAPVTPPVAAQTDDDAEQIPSEDAPTPSVEEAATAEQEPLEDEAPEPADHKELAINSLKAER